MGAMGEVKTQPQLHLGSIECGVFIGCRSDGRIVVRGFGDIPDENLPALTNAMRLLAAKLTSEQRNRLFVSLLH